jgi:hypothetical protein
MSVMHVLAGKARDQTYEKQRNRGRELGRRQPQIFFDAGNL